MKNQSTYQNGQSNGQISQFMDHHYRHFNAAAMMDAAKAYKTHLDQGGKMFVTLAGARSTAELGLSLAEMIRQGKVHFVHRRKFRRRYL
jgi:deoxyhypusine synthase